MKLKLKPIVLLLGLMPVVALASSHREAPFISTMPQVDASDFYMFMSYEPGRAGYVTLLANYDPLQDTYSGPNFHFLNDNAVYDFKIDNNGDSRPDLTFRFTFTNTYKDLAVPAGGKQTSVPLINIGAVSGSDQSALGRVESYTVGVRHGESGSFQWLANAAGGSGVFVKPVDNIGNKSIADYAAYARKYVYNVNVPGCSQPGRLFVGQRKDGFVANLGEIFDLVNLHPLGPRDGTRNPLSDKNVTTLALELPAACLRDTAGDVVIGAWTTASIPKVRIVNGNGDGENGSPKDPFRFQPDAFLTQVSRLGSPLVNELVIGLKDKNKFNNSEPKDDGQFLNYVTNPSLPVLLNALFGVNVPQSPRNDLVAAFLTGVSGLNQPKNVKPSEMLRLNTSIAPTLPASQNDLGVLGGDFAGFPNGRRPYDDVVDIALRAEGGALCGVAGNCGGQTTDPNNGAPFTDGARAAGATVATARATGDENAADTYLDYFPYLMTPVPGSPNGSNGLPAN
jgi:hypothetical protein